MAGNFVYGPGKRADKIAKRSGQPIQRYTDAETLGLIQQADRVANTVRSWMPDGAGNMKQDVLKSNGKNCYRLNRARQLDVSTVLKRAQAAKTWGGAHCDEFSAMTYSTLVAEGVKNRPILRGHTRIGGHEFTLIGDPRAPGEPVVCDGWVLTPQGHAWKDNHWNRMLNMGWVTDQQWNDSRPNPEYDLSGIQTKSVTQEDAYAMFGRPADGNLGAQLVRNTHWYHFGLMSHYDYSTKIKAPHEYKLG